MVSTPSVLLSALGDFSESDYLRFIAERTPPTLQDELILDGAPELELNDVLDLEDFLKPLTSLSFPRNELFDFQFVLSFAIIGYGINDAVHNQYKMIYLCSLYLHSYAMDEENTQDGISPLASSLIAQACLEANIDTRIHVIKLLLWLLDNGQGFEYREDNPRSNFLLAVSFIWASLLNELGDESEQLVTEEPILYLPDANKLAGKSASELRFEVFKSVLDKVFGETGQVVSSATRFRQIGVAKMRYNIIED